MSSLDKASVEALKVLAAPTGAIRPVDVLEAARDPDHALHKHFTWDDGEAAERYRLQQAGTLIRRARVTITPREGGPSVNVRAFVSLEADRGREGYRTVEAVIASPALKSEMLAAALAELRALRRKYADLAELAGVHVAIDQLLNAPQAMAANALSEAVKFAVQLEQGNGLDRTTAAQRASDAFRVPANDVIEALRKAS